MLGDITAADDIFIVCGRTDMRKSIDGLCVIVNKKVPKMAEKIPHFIYLGKSTAIDAFPSF